MGCDIHMAVERLVNGNWVCLKTRNKYYEEDEDKSDWYRYTADVLDFGRDYALFNIVAYNSHRVPKEHLNFYWEARGVPEDVSDYARRMFFDDCDLHTPSYLLLTELEETVADLSKEIRSKYEVSQNTPREQGCLSDFLDTVREQLSTLLPEVPSNEIRILIAFDN